MIAVKLDITAPVHETKSCSPSFSTAFSFLFLVPLLTQPYLTCVHWWRPCRVCGSVCSGPRPCQSGGHTLCSSCSPHPPLHPSPPLQVWVRVMCGGCPADPALTCVWWSGDGLARQLRRSRLRTAHTAAMLIRCHGASECAAGTHPGLACWSRMVHSGNCPPPLLPPLPSRMNALVLPGLPSLRLRYLAHLPLLRQRKLRPHSQPLRSFLLHRLVLSVFLCLGHSDNTQ